MKLSGLIFLKTDLGQSITTFISRLGEVLQSYWGRFLFFLPKGMLAIFIILLAFFIAGKLSRFFSSRLQPKAKDPLLLAFLMRILRYFLIIMGIMIPLQIIGFTGIATGLLAGAGISAFVIGFVFKDIGENFLAGIILAFNRPFRIKDTIKVNDFIGKVTALNLRTTLAKTFDGKDIYIPNSIILKQPLTNFTRDGLNRHEFAVNIGFEHDADEVSNVIVESIIPVEGVVKKLPPFVTIEELKNNGMDLKVYFWVHTYDYKKRTNVIKTDVLKAVKIALINAGYIKGAAPAPAAAEHSEETKTELARDAPKNAAADYKISDKE